MDVYDGDDGDDGGEPASDEPDDARGDGDLHGGEVAEEGPEDVVVVGKHGEDGVIHRRYPRRGPIRPREANDAPRAGRI